MGRVEVFLVSREDQVVRIDGREFSFSASEHLLTEYSHKYTVAGFADLAARAGFSLHRFWTDRKGLFAVLHLVAENQASAGS